MWNKTWKQITNEEKKIPSEMEMIFDALKNEKPEIKNPKFKWWLAYKYLLHCARKYAKGGSCGIKSDTLIKWFKEFISFESEKDPVFKKFLERNKDTKPITKPKVKQEVKVAKVEVKPLEKKFSLF